MVFSSGTKDLVFDYRLHERITTSCAAIEAIVCSREHVCHKKLIEHDVTQRPKSAESSKKQKQALAILGPILVTLTDLERSERASCLGRRRNGRFKTNLNIL
jgi:hypothetical protein